MINAYLALNINFPVIQLNMQSYPTLSTLYSSVVCLNDEMDGFLISMKSATSRHCFYFKIEIVEQIDDKSETDIIFQ